ncbi:MAG: hypothetical protein ACR2GY_07620 [Phycisphaerales bacterium]
MSMSRLRWLCQVVGVCAVAWAVAANSAQGQSDSPRVVPPAEARSQQSSRGDGSRQPTSLLTRQVRHFDFEEIVEQPYLMPIGFERVLERPGLTDFGSMQFSNQHAHDGNWSFEFELAGGSMAMALHSKEISIVPGGNYLITGYIRTEGITHARARLSARFDDQRMEPLHGSTKSSELVRSPDAWQRVSIAMPAPDRDAASLIVELEVLQPGDFQTGVRDRSVPQLEDVSGRVWFDDITIWHIPTVSLTTGQPDERVLAQSDQRLRIAVNDIAGEPLDARLTIVNVNSEVVHRSRFTLERGREAQDVDLRRLPSGWYQAQLTLLNSSDVELASRELRFIFQQADASIVESNTMFGLNLDSIPVLDVSRAAGAVKRLELPFAVFPAWDSQSLPTFEDPRMLEMRDALDALIESDVAVMLSLASVPDLLADELRIDSEQVLDAFAADRKGATVFLEPMLIHFGQRVRAWQVGTAADGDVLMQDDLATAVESVRVALSRLVPGPRIILPVPLEQRGSTSLPADVHLVIPSAFAPESLPAALEGAQPFMVTVEALDDEYATRDRITDLALRMLYLRRAGMTQIACAEPFMQPTDADDNGGNHANAFLQPSPFLLPWLTLGSALSERSFAGEVAIGYGLRCWLFEGPRDAILIAWNETALPSSAVDPSVGAVLDAQLSNGPLTVTDLAGNLATIPLTNMRHQIPLTDQPVIIRGIDPYLARFRQGFAIEPAFAEAVQREHVHTVRVPNPWPMSISGTVKFRSPSGWQFGPRRLRFSIPAGGEVEIPFTLAFSRMEVAGIRRIVSDVEFEADRPYTFRIASDFELGLDELDLNASWRMARALDESLNDIVIAVNVANTGQRAMQLEAYVLAPGYPRMRRVIARLEPGESTVKTFSLANGASNLRGQTILVGIGEVESTARLNQRIEIPADPAIGFTQVDE